MKLIKKPSFFYDDGFVDLKITTKSYDDGFVDLKITTKSYDDGFVDSLSFKSLEITIFLGL